MYHDDHNYTWNANLFYSDVNSYHSIEIPSILSNEESFVISRAVTDPIKLEAHDDGYDQNGDFNHPSVHDDWLTSQPSTSYQMTIPHHPFKIEKRDYDTESVITELQSFNNDIHDRYFNNYYMDFQLKEEIEDINDISNSNTEIFKEGELDQILKTSADELLENVDVHELIADIASDGVCNLENEETAPQTMLPQLSINRKHFKCSQCIFTTNRREYLEEHSSKLHSDSAFNEHDECSYSARSRNKKENNILDEIPINSRRKREIFKCSMCSYNSKFTNRLQKHIKKSHGKATSGNDKEHKNPKPGKENGQSKSSSNNSKSKSHKCQQCSFSSLRSDRLKKHVAKIHSKNICYKCNLCSYKSTYNRDYYDHMKQHYGGPPFKCQFCQYKSRMITAFMAHRVLHTGDRLLIARYVPSIAKRKYHLKGHMISHSREKNFVCPYCLKRYSYKCSLVRHLKTACKDGKRI